MGTKAWAKSTNGPDWMDVESLMRAIGTLHSARVAFGASPIGIGSNGGVSILVTANFENVPDALLPGIIVVESQWPNNAGLELVGEVFGMLYQLDFQIGEAYKQKQLFE